MGDEMDRVQAVNEWWQEECLAEHRRRSSLPNPPPPGAGDDSSPQRGEDGRGVCIDCGEEIPEKRRRAVPGCRRCIDCQTYFERRNR